MSLVVDLCEILKIQMRVDLRGRNAGMTQHLLHRTQVATGLQDMRCERVAQHMRMHVAGESLFDATGFQPDLHCAWADGLATLVQEKRRFISLWQGIAL